MERLKLYKQMFYGSSSSSGSIMFCSGNSVPPLGHFGPQPSHPRPDKVGTEPKPPTYTLRRHLSFCLVVRRFRTRVLPSSLTFLHNFSSACKREVLRFLDKLRPTSWLPIPQGGAGNMFTIHEAWILLGYHVYWHNQHTARYEKRITVFFDR